MEHLKHKFTSSKKYYKIRLLTLPVIFSFFLPFFFIHDFVGFSISDRQRTVMKTQIINEKSSVAANFLNSLNKSQREVTQFEFADPSKVRWHYLPGATWTRQGIQLHELNNHQKELLFLLLRDFLSETGYNKTKRIISLEEVLVEMGGSAHVRDPEKYFAAFYGNPEKDSLWAWSFEGHHVSLNFTVLDNKVSMTPRFFGANPATVPYGKRKGERTLDKEEDYGMELIRSMSDNQKKQVVFSNKTFYDITTTNSPEVNPPEAVGIKMKELNRMQQNLLLDLIAEYLAAMPSELASQRIENLKKEEYDEIRFGWAGSTKPGEAHYYRIQGKTFLVEFDNSQNNANHIHTVWRDFDGDFGSDLIREHYKTSDHHHPHK